MRKEKIMRFSRSTALLMATTLALSACGPVNRGLESANQPVVQRTDYVYDVGNAGGLSQVDHDRLVAWFDTLHLGYGDQVSVDDRSNNAGTRADIAAVVARYGLFLSETAPLTEGSGDASEARVVVSRSTAAVPSCPNWSRPSQPEFAASGMSNFGCAVNSNLAAMVANPTDLVQGQTGSGNDPRTISRAIKTYREAQPTGVGPLKAESAKGGN
jgi:Type IV pili component